jgi:AcrR family transcriptional regulator/DNA-binding transcriptional ArsR family regulator
MAETTVINARADALARRIATVDADQAGREAVALGLVDALLEADDGTLGAALDALRDARARADGDQEMIGWLDAAIAFAHWGVERVPADPPVPGGTQAQDFLRLLEGSPWLASSELRRRLGVDETQVSRSGRRLLESGLVARRKVGRQALWQLTPRGKQALEQPPVPARSSDSDFWQAALRRGFEAAGDETGEPREVDPDRERIVENTLALHRIQGIQATTWEEIAAKAGYPVETVKELFPTQDELVRSCATHFMESLRLPPADRASEVFTGASSETERIRRLVQAFFGAYERGADGIAVARRERNDLPVVDESLRALDDSFDAVVAEAVRPLGADSQSVASLRALTDLEIWRTLRDQGATPEGAVDQASAAVERWLDARPTR